MRSSTEAKVTIPEGNPVIYEKLDYLMRGEFNYLYIYGDGSAIYIEEKGMRLPVAGHPPTRTWKTGTLTAEQLDSLLAYFAGSSLDKLDGYYLFPGKPIEGGGLSIGDMGFTITVNLGDSSKTVTASNYLTPDNGETYPDMPPPLNEIYLRLRAVAQGTEEVAHENIPNSRL
jgi:hypothetical protein